MRLPKAIRQTGWVPSRRPGGGPWWPSWGQAVVAGKVGYSTPETCWTTRTTWQE